MATAAVVGCLMLLAGLNYMFLSLFGQFVVRTFRRSSAEAEHGVVRIHRGGSKAPGPCERGVQLSGGQMSNVSMVKPWEREALSHCPLCGGVDAVPVVDRHVRGVPLRFVKSTGCGLVYQNPRLTLGAAREYFNSTTFFRDGEDNEGGLESLLGYPDYGVSELGVRRTAAYRLRRISAFVPPPARLLEIGSATGVFLDEARLAGYEVRGLDLSAPFAERAGSVYGLEVDVASVEDFPLPERAYDVICCWGGIPCWHDFVKGLANVGRSLKSGGVFVMTHSNIESLLARVLGSRYFEFNPGVFTVFSVSTMSRALDMTGFDSIVVETDRQFASVGWILTYLRSTFLLRAVRALGIEKAVVPVVALTSVFRVCRNRSRD